MSGSDPYLLGYRRTEQERLERPEEIVAAMVRLVRPGGFVALHEPDSTAQRCDPPLEAHTRLLQILDTYASMQGIDRSIGLRAPRMLRESGVVDVQVNALVHAYPPGHGRRRLVLEFVANTKARILENEPIGAAELDELVAALSAHLDDPTTLVISSLFVQTWGRIPDAQR